MLFCFTAKCLQKTVNRKDTPHISCHRFYNDCSNLVTFVIHLFYKSINIVIRNNDRVFCRAFCDTRAVRTAESRRTRSGFHKEAVAMPMIAAGKFQYFISSCITAGSTKSAHRRLRSGRNKSYFFNGWVESSNQFGQFCFYHRRRAVARTVFRRFLNRGNHSRVGMSQNHRSPGADIVYIGISINIGNMRSLCRCNKRRRTVHMRIGTDRAVHSAGHVIPRLFKSRSRTGQVHHLPASSFSHLAASSA